MNERGRREKDNESEEDGGNCVVEEIKGTVLEGSGAINITLLLYRPLTCIVQQTVPPANFSPDLPLQRKMDLRDSQNM